MGELVNKEVSHYHILERLGEGGMAEVYKAVDLNLDREVAIKFLRIDPRNFERSKKRFEIEAKALAKLDHPNIVRVLDYGDYEGRPYLVMEYIPGGNLKQRLGKPIPWKEACALLFPIAEALQYANDRKIIHRDVKPSNILLKADGTPMLSDFGVAKMLEMEETLDLTGTSVGVGTPYYMAPEQIKGATIDGRADMYSLGIVLYELVTGRKPYQADTWTAILMQHVQEPLPRPSKFVKRLPASLERVFFKALAKDPQQRFNSLKDFSVVMNNLVNDKKYFNFSLPSKNYQKNNRKKIIISLAIIGLFSSIFYLLNTRNISNAELHEGNTSLAKEIFAIFNKTKASEQNGFNNEQLFNINEYAWVGNKKLENQYNAFSICPNKKLFAVGSSAAVIIYSLPQIRQETIIIDQASEITGISWSPTCSKLIVSEKDGLVNMWTLDDQYTASFHYQINDNSRLAAWSPDGTKIVLATKNNLLLVFEVENLVKPIKTWYVSPVTALSWSPNSKQIATSSENFSVGIWNIEDGSSYFFPTVNYSPVHGIAWSPDGLMLATCGDKDFIRVWDVSVPTPSILAKRGVSISIEGITWSPDGTKIALGGRNVDGISEIWWWQSDQVRVIDEDKKNITGIEWISDNILIDANSSGEIGIWNIP